MKTKIIPLPWRAVAVATLFAFALNSSANPTGMTVQSGSATLTVNGSQFTITTSQNAVMNWQSLNIAENEKTIFNQPSATSIAWNRVNDPNPSQIFGSIQANGVVVLLNSSGFYFGPHSFVSAAGLVVSTANCAPPQNGGGAWEFNGPPPLASIVNFGTIKIGNGGSAFLIADKVENHGDIEAPGGSIGLAAGQTVTLSERPDGRGMSMNVLLPRGSVDNFGNIVADSGIIALNAKVVNQNGILQANSVQNKNGVIELVASDELNLGADSKILARGDGSAGGSSGGSVTLKSENIFQDANGSEIVTAGGAHGGNGGNVEVSAPNILSLNSAMDARAQAGFAGGEFLLDPVNIILGTTGSGTVPNDGTVASGSSPGTLNLNVNTAFANKNFSNIKLQATGNITVSTGTTWDLSSSTGTTDGDGNLVPNPNGTLTLQAHGDIIFGNNALITDANNWTINLLAGVSFPSEVVQPGTGNIYLNGGNGKTLNGAIQSGAGAVNLLAANNILVGSGFVRSTGGGNVSATALGGSINTGTLANGYSFFSSTTPGQTLYSVSPNLGGISTTAGGDVTLFAGQNIASLLPGGNKPSGDAGSGAFGSAAGNVSITAGGNVTGHYVVANGTGTIITGGSAGISSAQLALSLIKGGWNVNAAQDIVLQEVRNPNGVFNSLGGRSAVSKHFFDYGAADFVNLTAGNAIEFLGSSLPRNSGAFEAGIPMIFPGILNLVAGAGGITLDRDLILFPSPQGSLTVLTTAGGGLLGNLTGGLAALVVSDSGSSQYNVAGTFGYSDHAAVPVHLNSATPITLNISGDLNNILLAVPEAAQVSVGGNMNNSRFIGQNLHGTDATTINVTGDIVNRNAFTTVSLTTAPDLALLGQAYPFSDFYSSLISLLSYDPATKTLTFHGRMTSEQLAALTSLTIQLLDAEGLPRFDNDGNAITTTVNILDSSLALALFNASQDIEGNPSTGYFVGGGGSLNINAHNLDLGTTLGIQSIGPLNNFALANYFNHGAEININLTGNLDMFSTTICSLNGGDVNVNVAGSANIGSSTFSGNDQMARGIFTVAKSDVTVITGGDINVNGSRIAAYDGGNVTVESLNGNVNAGRGGAGSVAVQGVFVDPVTHEIFTDTPTIPGSGILATTFPPSFNPAFPQSVNHVGNILVEAPNGNVNASAGGIVQLPLNSVDSPNAVVQVLAGLELRDVNGQAVHANVIGKPSIAATIAAAAIGDPLHTVELNHQKFSVSDATWTKLLGLLNLSPGAGEEFVITVAGDSSSLKTALTGDGLGLANYNYQTRTAANKSIDASGSGVIGSTIKLNATADIKGVIFARNNIDINAQQNVSVTAVASGNVNVNSGGTISGTIVGVGGVSASGSAIDASLLSQNVSTSGDASGATQGFAQGTAANATSQATSSEDSKNAKTDATEDDDSKKKGKPIVLAQKVSRVTVILPAKRN